MWHWGPLVSHTVVKGKHIVYDKLSPCYTSHSHLQFSPVHVIKRSDTTDVAAMLSDLHHKDGTHYSTGRWEVREYLLTPWCRVLLEKLTGLQLVKKFPAIHGTQKFITALTSVRQLSLSWANPIQSTFHIPPPGDPS